MVGLVAAIAAVGYFMFGGTGYTVKAQFLNGGQIVQGNNVQIAGVKVGTVGDIKITPVGQAELTLNVQGDYVPLRQGTKAIIRQNSLSSIAGRYIDLQLPDGNVARNTIPNGGRIGIDNTVTQVDLDEVFNTLDPVARVAVQQFFRGQARQYRGKGAQANAGFRYLNPALSTSSGLFTELNRDNPLLSHFLHASADLTTTLAQRTDDLTNLITNLNITTRALGNQREPLKEALTRFPGFIRTADTTFVNLRGTLDELDPLVKAQRPVARKLPAFFNELRPFVRNARPTLRDLSRVVRQPGADNDLVELNRTFPPLARVALDSQQRNGKKRVGAFPEVTKALKDGAPIQAFARAYSPDFVGWFDDFSHTGAYDALGGFSRSQIYANLFNQGMNTGQVTDAVGQIRSLNASIDTLQGMVAAGVTNVGAGLPGPLAGLAGQPVQDALTQLRSQRADLLNKVLTPLEDRAKQSQQNVRQQQYRRCPGSAEEAAPDGSNVFSQQEQGNLDCREADRATGNF